MKATQLIYNPERLIDRLRSLGLVDDDNVETAREFAQEQAEYTTEHHPEGHGFGSSDMFADVISVARSLGYKYDGKDFKKLQRAKLPEVIQFEDIKPVGNFDEILTKINKKAEEVIAGCHKEKAYNKSLANIIKLLCAEMDVIGVLEEGLQKGDGWNQYEMLQCLLYAHLIVAKCNQTAHTYLNGKTDWEPYHKQIQDTIDEKPEVYQGLRIIA